MSVPVAQYPNWDGLSENSQRTIRTDDIQPDHRDYDRIAAELLAHQTAIAAVVSSPFIPW